MLTVPPVLRARPGAGGAQHTLVEALKPHPVARLDLFLQVPAADRVVCVGGAPRDEVKSGLAVVLRGVELWHLRRRVLHEVAVHVQGAAVARKLTGQRCRRHFPFFSLSNYTKWNVKKKKREGEIN